jgi:hypothetical protein
MALWGFFSMMKNASSALIVTLQCSVIVLARNKEGDGEDDDEIGRLHLPLAGIHHTDRLVSLGYQLRCLLWKNYCSTLVEFASSIYATRSIYHHLPAVDIDQKLLQGQHVRKPWKIR